LNKLVQQADTATLRIGTRGSELALWQAHFTQSQLTKAGIPTDLVVIKTQGDNVQNLGFDKLEGKGFFTKEIEDALLEGKIDVAVHSMKDLPTSSPEGLSITAVSYRENPADWLLIRKESVQKGKIFKLKEKATVGTSSARRKAQMRHYRPDVQLQDVRGNVPTRVEKLRNGKFDAILLAAAGLSRLELDLSDFELVELNVREFVPAPAQGVLAFQTRTEDTATRRILKKLHHPDIAAITNIERRVLQLLEGGCHMPLGVYCEQDRQGNFHVWAALADTWDSPVRRTQVSMGTSANLPEIIMKQLKQNG